MMSLIILPETQSEIDHALDCSNRPDEFRLAIEEMWQTILNQPAIAPRIPRTPCRRFFLPKYPYSAIYFADGDRLIVMAFPHHRQKPGYWKRRLKTI